MVHEPAARSPEQHGGLDLRGHRANALARATVGAQDRSVTTNPRRLDEHPFQIDTDMRGQIDLVDDQEIALDHAGSALARDVIAAGEATVGRPSFSGA